MERNISFTVTMQTSLNLIDKPGNRLILLRVTLVCAIISQVYSKCQMYTIMGIKKICIFPKDDVYLKNGKVRENGEL